MDVDATHRDRSMRTGIVPATLLAAVLATTLAACDGAPVGTPAPMPAGSATTAGGPAGTGPSGGTSAGSSAGGGPVGTASNVGGPAPTVDAEKQITVTITRRKVSPPPKRIDVARGTLVRVTVTSDTADDLHVHGYDLSTGLRAGVPATIEFHADRAGLFEVETHESDLVLFQLAVR